MYAALAGVFMLSSGFDINDTTVHKSSDDTVGYYNCWFAVRSTYRNLDGSTGTRWDYFNTHAASDSDCSSQAGAASFSPYSTSQGYYFSNY